MIESIDSKTVCGHLKATLSGIIPDQQLQEWIGRLNSLDPDQFEQVAKDLATVFTNAFQGNYEIPPERIPHLSVKGTVQRYDRAGKPVRGNNYVGKWNILNRILDLPCNTESDNIYAALTNLKSACVIKTLSRKEKDEAYAGITHKTIIDSKFVINWRNFVCDFTDYLLDQLKSWISDEVEYNPIWMTPSSSKSTSYINNDGRLLRAAKGDLRSLSAVNLRHPDINRIARMYPDEFASATLLGFPVLGAEFDLPTPLQGTIPVGRVSISPKRAQKSRIVFIPLQFLDSMSRPAFSKLTSLYCWNVQGVLSHDESRQFAQDLIVNNPDNEEIWSFDQSSFTDNFDYNQIQRPILEALLDRLFINEYDLAVIDCLNNGYWDAKSIRKDSLIRFGTGTGMGTPPSFPLASLGNGYLYAYAYTLVHGYYPDPRPNHPTQGKVVGDDIVIRGTAVARQYIQLCRVIGLSINESKSMHSTQVAELCGKLISNNGIFDKKKLIDITTYAGLADAADYYRYSMDEYLESFPEFIPIYEQLKGIPRPFGLAEPINLVSHKSIDKMTTAEAITLLRAQVSQLHNIVMDGNVPPRGEWLELIKRKDFLPRPVYELNIDPSIDGLVEAREAPSNHVKEIARNALDLYKDHASEASLEQLLQAATVIDTIYRTVYRLIGDDLLKPNRGEHVLLRKRDRSTKVRDILEDVLELTANLETPDLSEKGDDHYEK